jgi:4-amino-4-deoxy-L-arabinose transferase-like glycosyltransferase
MDGKCPLRGSVLLALVLAYAALMWIWGAGRLDIAHSMEAARAVGAREMMRSGDYLIPRLGGHVNLAKPPLFYWAVALVSLPGGEVTEGTVRLPSALSAMLVLLALYLAVRPTFGVGTAIVSCLAAATLPMVFSAATVGEVNMLLALGVTVSILSAFTMLEGRRVWLNAALCGVGLSVGLMAKGPIALLFFVPTMLLYIGYRTGGRLADDWRLSLAYMVAVAVLVRLALFAATRGGPVGALLYAVPVGMLVYFGLRNARGVTCGRCWLVALAVVLVLSLPWPVLAARHLGFGNVREVLVREFWQARSGNVGASNRAPIWYYLVRLPAAALPWSLLAIPAFFPRYGAEATEGQRRLLLLARCWLVGSVVLFSVVSPARRVRYLLPVFPAVSLLAADVLMRSAAGGVRSWMARHVRIWAAACVYAFCAAPFVLVAVWLAEGLRFSAWAVAMALVAATGAAAGVYWRRRRHSPFAPLVGLVLVMLGAKMLLHFGLSQAANEEESSRAACQSIREHVQPGEHFYFSGQVHPDVLFYLDPEAPGLAGARQSRGHALVCTEAGVGKAAQLADIPPGWTYNEIDRARYGKKELVLLRLDATIPPRATAPDGDPTRAEAP